DNLSFNNRRIDEGADVLRRDIVQDLHLAGFRVDIDHGDMSAAREAAEFRVVEGGHFEAGIELLRDALGGEVALLRQILERDALGSVDGMDDAVGNGELLDRYL